VHEWLPHLQAISQPRFTPYTVALTGNGTIPVSNGAHIVKYALVGGFGGQGFGAGGGGAAVDPTTELPGTGGNGAQGVAIVIQQQL
jgi:hypothetical protein